jgi:hypothetical protein
MKDEKKAAPPVAAPEPMPQTGCVVCGSYAGKFVEVTAHARAHEECSAARPDVIRKVKARA